MKSAFFAERATFLWTPNNIFTFLSSLFLFMLFKQKKAKYNSGINFVAASMFAVYLIHDHQLIRGFLWKSIICAEKYQDSLFLILYIVLSVIVIMGICVVIDIIRRYLVEKTVLKYLTRFLDKEKIH